MKNALFLFFFLCSPLWGNIQIIHSLCPFQEQAATLSSDDLVIFDVDETLIMSTDAVLQPPNHKFIYDWLGQNNLQLNAEEHAYFLSLILHQRKARLVESCVSSLISSLQTRGVKVIALTAMDPGKLGTIPSMEAWRLAELNQLGIHFFSPFLGVNWVSLLPKSKSPALYVNGMICSGNHPKGDVLIAFLKSVCFMPKRVFFFDDKMRNIESVGKELSKIGIPYSGYYYLAASDERDELDPEVASLQIHTLLKEKKWISDTEAHEILSTPTP